MPCYRYSYCNSKYPRAWLVLHVCTLGSLTLIHTHTHTHTPVYMYACIHTHTHTPVVKSVRDLPRFFAERLYWSMKGLGTDDDTLVRVMVSRSEKDMVQIKAAFPKLFPGKTDSLEKFIKVRQCTQVVE